LVLLNRPRYWLGRAPGRPLVGAMTKAIPWPPRVGYSGMIAKTKVVEKVKAVLFIEFLKVTGFG
jgi:hypothetical protein